LTSEPRDPREASENDVPALTALINEAYSPAEGFLYEGPRITTGEVRSKLDHGRFLLERDANGTLRGCVYVTVTGDSGYFGLLAVSPTDQGRGLGRSLVKAAESLCRSKGCRSMTLDVVDSRRELFSFYARLGYEVAGERPFDDPRLNRPSHFVVMRKVLAPQPEEPALRKPVPALETAALTVVAMLAFATNSLLCRAALAGGHADATSFTTIRLAGGALVLGLLVRARESPQPGVRPGWDSALALFVYALAFSLAYLRIAAGVGALLMFAAVQLTMIGAGLRAGERPRALEWIGLASSVAGLVVLTRPGLSRPDLVGAFLMLAAGVAWGLYSLRGRRSTDAVAANASSFARAVPLALGASALLALLGVPHLSRTGALLALASGALASGLGYAVWYAALRGHTATSAAIVQLLVPPLAAAGGVLVLGESVSARLLVGSVLILSGIALAVVGRRPS
jgi:drug/metabolite transporter (DMT)-like permease/ribosomal protein S18 acetylase RimI-like enzyme